jgi:hypothetical protein
MANEYQRQQHLINYNNFNQVTHKFDNIKENKRVVTHTHNLHYKNKSSQRIQNNEVSKIYHQNICDLGNK